MEKPIWAYVNQGHFFMNVCDVVYVCILLLYVFIIYDSDLCAI